MISVPISVGGQFRLLTKKSKSGNIVDDTGWFNNILTNTGLDNLSGFRDNPFYYVQVGSGNSEPDPLDLALDNQIAQTALIAEPLAVIDQVERYWSVGFTGTFLSGSAAGTISELAIAPQTGTSVITSRALVRDGIGNPTSITVLSDEDLVVYYRFRIKQPVNDFEFVLPDGKNAIVRIANANSLASAAQGNNSLLWKSSLSSGLSPLTGNNLANTTWAYSGGIGNITQLPSGTSVSFGPNAGVLAPYDSGSRSRTGFRTLATGLGNDFDLRSFTFCCGPTVWQVEVDDPYTKTNLQTLRFTYGISWDRE